MAPNHQPARRVLVVEDEYLFAIWTCSKLLEAGADVLGPVSTVAAARSIVEDDRPDLVILDVNLLDGQSYGVADLMKSLGVQFVFSTSMLRSEMPIRFSTVPRLNKMPSTKQVQELLRNA